MDTQTTTQSQENKEILEIFNSLPEIIQKAITKSGWEVILRGVVSKYHLRIDQGTKLENMTFALMMGAMEPKEYFDLIHNDFDLETDVADSLFQDVDDKIFAHIEEMTRKLEEENASKQNTFVKEGVDMNRQADEVLTVTREEILRDIENPEEIKNLDNLPELKDSTVMPKQMPNGGGFFGKATPTPVPATKPISTIPQNPAKTVEIREEEIPSNLPTANPVPIKKETPQTISTKPLNPVDIGLTQTVSTSNKTYQSDPYREPIE